MAHKITVTERERDEKLRLARTLLISAHGREIKTPVRALSAARTPAYNEAGLFMRTKLLRAFIEVYRRLSRDKLLQIWADKKEEARFSSGITRSLYPVDTNRAIVMGIIEYDAGERPPEQLEVEFLVDLLNHPYFDLAVPPIIPKLPLKEYINFINAFLDVVETTRFHPILVPYVPNYVTRDLVKLFDYYVKEDRLSRELICVEFNGGNPISQYARVSLVVRKARLLERELGAPVALHALNLKYGKATKGSSVVPAKDLLIFAMGFDSFGWSHKSIPIQAGIGRYELATKLLNRADYGYYSFDRAKAHIKDHDAYRFTLKDVLRNRELARLYNAERQVLEAETIRTKVTEGELDDYLASKPRLVEGRLLDKVRKLQGKVRQAELA